MNEKATAIELFKRIIKKPIRSTFELKNGLNNYNLLINDAYVVRIRYENEDKYNPFYKTANEYNSLQIMKELSLGENLLYFNNVNGNKISKYIHRVFSYGDKPSESQITLVAKSLRKMHRICSSCNYEFNMFSRLDYYKNATKLNPLNKWKEKRIIKEAKNLYQKGHLVFCHNDLVKGNMLFRDNRLFLIDYEYAGLNSPLFDLASFLSENDLRDEETMIFFLRNYYGHKYNNLRLKEVKIFIRFLDLLWFYWAKMMAKKRNNPLYEEIANNKLKHLED